MGYIIIFKRACKMIVVAVPCNIGAARRLTCRLIRIDDFNGKVRFFCFFQQVFFKIIKCHIRLTCRSQE